MSISTASEELRQDIQKQAQVMSFLGFSALRPGQSQTVLHLYQKEDVLCLLPTSGGKSLCYMLPTLVKGWRTIIFCPLISLMKDQCDILHRFKLKAAMVNSSQQAMENDFILKAWAHGELQFLLVAPERLENNEFRLAMLQCPPNLVVIDEVHVASEWSHNFRPAYAKLGHWIPKFRPTVVLGLTATATLDVELDIRGLFGMEKARRVCVYTPRKNLHFHTARYDGGFGLDEALRQTQGSTLVYCATRAKCEEGAERVQMRYKEKSVGVYHAGLSNEERDMIQDRFMNDETRILFATNSFGMGINKASIRSIIHRDMPGSLEAYVQESGRAGRDGLDSHCTILWDYDSLGVHRFFLENNYPSKQVIERVFHLIDRIGEEEVQMTIKDMGIKLGEHGMKVEAALKFLVSQGVLQRQQQGPEATRLAFVTLLFDPIYKPLKDVIEQLGVKTADGMIEFRVEEVGEVLNRSAAWVKKRLSSWQKSGGIEMDRPYRGSTTRIVGDLSQVDFSIMESRGDRAERRLEEIQTFYDVPDEDKHAYLVKYFGRRIEIPDVRRSPIGSNGDFAAGGETGD